MADYNIYIHSYGQYDSPTTPFQLRADSDSSGVGGEGGAGGSGFGSVRRAASFITNPDSAIGQVQGFVAANMGKLLPFALTFAMLNLGKKVLDLYVPFVSNATGDFSFQIKYNNFFQGIQNITHPFSSFLTTIQNRMQENLLNRRNEQERLLFGGTIYDSRYGRKL